MDCPQCGGTLSTYSYDDREAFVCERCGYVGIEADHHGEPVEVESWTDALRRFHEEHEESAVGSEQTLVEHVFGETGVDDVAGDESSDDESGDGASGTSSDDE